MILLCLKYVRGARIADPAMPRASGGACWGAAAGVAAASGSPGRHFGVPGAGDISFRQAGELVPRVRQNSKSRLPLQTISKERKVPFSPSKNPKKEKTPSPLKNPAKIKKAIFNFIKAPYGRC